jgi:membrane fusion protein (multidrug efflux system)
LRTHIFAYVDGRIHTVTVKISGTVKTLYVTDNQLVKKGDLLVEIDPVDCDVRVERPQKQL